nr:hypothetical protein B0A51_12424 [Rachicladosporium sp. CCFEE 5018]
MQSLEAALPFTQPQQCLSRQDASHHILSGEDDHYARLPLYTNAQAVRHLSQYSYNGQPHLHHRGFQDYGPQYAMPGHQYQRLMMPNMQHPQMYLPPGYFHRYESAPMMHTEWRHSLEPRQAGSYTGTNSMSYNHSAHSAQQPSRGMIFTPRGPPRKPRQSGFALWVGNLPPSAGIADLKDHFSRDATKSIESFFLIAKSNCAFVNYRTEASCTAAMHRFHDSRFNGVRLVCRLRKGATANSLVPPPESASPPALTHSESPDSELESPGTPTIVRGPPANPLAKVELAPAVTAPQRLRILASFFILKSLTSQDLDASVRRGEWTTQVHNEAALNAAFECAENVYLIFSANK